MGGNYFCENDFELELNSEYHLNLPTEIKEIIFKGFNVMQPGCIRHIKYYI